MPSAGEVSAAEHAEEPVAPVGAGSATYLPHLDGMRAIAVYLVVLFHAGIGRFVGGFIGVDVFFVLSGYLVTRLLLRDLDGTGSVRLVRFYGRRFRRLLPAALLLLVATALIYPRIATPLEVEGAEPAMRAASLWFSNWYFIAQSADYFASDVQANPVLHFWSLSIEEQFYLAWPILFGSLVLVARRRGNRGLHVVRLVVVAGALASLAAALWIARTDVTRAYYGTDTRAYQLLAGAVLAMSPGIIVRWTRLRTRSSAGATWSAAVPWIGLVVLGVAASSAFELSPVSRGLIATVVTLVLIVSLAAGPSGARSVLSVAPLAYLGKVSYGTYLWHWIVILTLTATFEIGPVAVAAITIVVATGVAALSYHVVELPVRSSPWLDRRPGPVIAVALTASLLTGLVLLPWLLDRGAEIDRTPSGTDPTGGQPVPADLDWRAAAEDHRTPPSCPVEDPDACTVVQGGEPHVLLLGDSNAGMYVDTFVGLAERRSFTLSVATAPGCLWPEGIARADNLEPAGTYGLTPVDLCRGTQRRWYETIVPALDPDVIVLVHRAIDDPVDPLALVDDADAPVDLATEQGRAVYERQVRSLLDQFTDASAAVVIVEPIPVSSPEDDPLACLSGAELLEQCRFDGPDGPTTVEQIYREVADDDPDVWSLDVDRLACPQLPTCDPVVDDVIVRWNPTHLTDTFAATLVDPFEQRLEDLGLLG
jgi:peptidoglycan/LPS O-acetylase OafA/YrhL